MAELVLVGLWGSEEGREHRIKTGDSMVLGRSSKVEISIHDPKLSRQHCEFDFWTKPENAPLLSRNS